MENFDILHLAVIIIVYEVIKNLFNGSIKSHHSKSSQQKNPNKSDNLRGKWNHIDLMGIAGLLEKNAYETRTIEEHLSLLSKESYRMQKAKNSKARRQLRF